MMIGYHTMDHVVVWKVIAILKIHLWMNGTKLGP